MSDHVAEYLAQLEAIRVAKDAAVAAWEAMSHADRIRAMEGERDGFLARAVEAEKAGRPWEANWHRNDARRVQERIDKFTRVPCPACGQPAPHSPEAPHV